MNHEEYKEIGIDTTIVGLRTGHIPYLLIPKNDKEELEKKANYFPLEYPKLSYTEKKQ